MKTLLVVTGPQGSGNHLWAKIFSSTAGVYGWEALKTSYWVPHDQEPFAAAWHDASKLKDIEFSDYAVTSISCPYALHGETVEPDYYNFINAARNIGYDVKVAIIGRDQTVLQYQQERVRRTHSLYRFEQHLDYLCRYDPVFLSTELLFLYGMQYLHSLRAQLKFPLHITKQELAVILAEDPNAKYFSPCTGQPLDDYVRTVSGLNTTKQ